ncbi:MAG: response regulator [Alphaproteobacteria bacterium]|nr:response regulator [Alphaproteobacteria bacterium]MCB9700025.1 response regulator [Alphaproteobacteria bacterium]
MLDLPRVLIVDDVDLVRRAVGRALKGRCVVDEAGDGPTALALLEDRPYDLVLLDMNLDQVTGREVYERVVRTHPHHLGEVVFVSGGFGTAERTWIEEQGLRWVVKPITTDIVRAMVGELRLEVR